MKRVLLFGMTYLAACRPSLPVQPVQPPCIESETPADAGPGLPMVPVGLEAPPLGAMALEFGRRCTARTIVRAGMRPPT